MEMPHQAFIVTFIVTPVSSGSPWEFAAAVAQAALEGAAPFFAAEHFALHEERKITAEGSSMHGMKDVAAKNKGLILVFHKKNGSVYLVHCSKWLIQGIKVEFFSWGTWIFF